MSGKHHGHGGNEEFYELRNVFRQDGAGNNYIDTITSPVNDETLMSDSRQPVNRPLPQPGSLSYVFRRNGEELR